MHPPRAQRSEIIDRFGELREQLKPFKSAIDEEEKLAKLIRAWHEDDPPDLPLTEEGEHYVIELGPRANRRHFKPGAMRRLSQKIQNFFQLVKLGLEDFDAHIPIEERGKYVLEARTGPRKLEVFAKLQKAA